MFLNPPPAQAASPWVQRWSHLVAPGATVLDVACGLGRHVRWFTDRGHHVTGVDRAPAHVQALADLAATGRAELVQADIENAAWPLMEAGRPRLFGAVVVTNYLWRPLMPLLRESLAPGGVLLYETFAHGNAAVGKPARPDFLLQGGELLDFCRELRIVAYEDGFRQDPPRYIQRIAAVQAARAPSPADNNPALVARYLLPS